MLFDSRRVSRLVSSTLILFAAASLSACIPTYYGVITPLGVVTGVGTHIKDGLKERADSKPYRKEIEQYSSGHEAKDPQRKFKTVLIEARLNSDMLQIYSHSHETWKARERGEDYLLEDLARVNFVPGIVYAGCKRYVGHAVGDRSIEFFQQAIALGDVGAMTAMANSIDESNKKAEKYHYANSFDQLARDQALALYKKALEQGDLLAAYELNQLGVRNLPKKQQEIVNRNPTYPNEYKSGCFLYRKSVTSHSRDLEKNQQDYFEFVRGLRF